MSNLRNYTSTVAPAKSQAAIEQLLVQAGATTVSKFYGDDKRCEGFFFQMKVGLQLLAFKLPAQPELVYQTFLRKASRLDAKKRTQLRAQADRTAWRTLHEWAQIQLDMIAMQQVDPLQVLLGFQFDEKTGQTMAERVASGNVKLLNS